jgi:hypothetical protein
MRFKSFEDYWQPFLMGQGPAGIFVWGLTPEAQNTLRDQVRLLPIKARNDSFTLGARTWAVRGTVPREPMEL